MGRTRGTLTWHRRLQDACARTDADADTIEAAACRLRDRDAQAHAAAVVPRPAGDISAEDVDAYRTALDAAAAAYGDTHDLPIAEAARRWPALRRQRYGTHR